MSKCEGALPSIASPAIEGSASLQQAARNGGANTVTGLTTDLTKD
jgi:hypothetical protein